MYHASVMTKTIHRYLFREIAVPFLLGMATFTSVLLMGRLLKLADLVVARGVPLADVLRMVVFLLPSFCILTIPMAFLLALLLAFGRLSADSEVTALKACGVSLYGLMPAVAGFALLAYLATTAITVSLLPWGNTSFKRLLTTILETRASTAIRERVFIDDFPGIILYVNRYRPEEQSMEGILIQDERNPAEPSTIFASRGTILAGPEARTLSLHLENGSIHRAVGKNDYRLAEFGTYDLTINLQQSVREIGRNELDLSLAELEAGIASPKTDPHLRVDMRLEFHRRFALPFACFIFALVGVPLGIQNQRSGKGAGFALSIGVIMIYYLVLVTGKTLGEKGLIPPAAAMWIPNAVFLLAGLYLFRQTAEEERLAIFRIVPAIATRLRALGNGGRRDA